ncbi:hypothetical protein BDZ90DRAFT_260819 [Jaminaea rosea]|uniref:Cyanovirin-N domain-containing protein n=1 Tax=Jaminaea rosea TaxID=1569628 RepID=A0A316UTC4_9BASI|nr:hypothetical protein BDZ90DRAFT_260819 [Jaminaea rosea]PWN27153.1 hypothetical protein BDZ90DRAFT_260819 [Jaminaea rosea]
MPTLDLPIFARLSLLALTFLLTLLHPLNAEMVGKCYRQPYCRGLGAPIEADVSNVMPIWSTCLTFASKMKKGKICKMVDCQNCTNLERAGGTVEGKFHCYDDGYYVEYCPN